ncbi:MAG: hypothetical protein DWQ05_06250 [Calditrichaeota bacterium]|nr:MAG: hypothetical protein DWQ05_06250 [Calditrichota bacterium]
MSQLQDYDISNKFYAKVRSTERITPERSPEVRDIILELNEDSDIALEPGQSVGVLVPGPHDFGNKHHLRLYSVAKTADKGEKINLCVKRCNYIDEVNGEEYKGVASNYLCDLRPGDEVELTGPYGMAFEIPADKNADIIMVGLGTGIAPFRAFIKNLYKKHKKWGGQIRLYYGERTGMEMLYLNDEKDDLAQYYDKETFQAFLAVSPKPYLDKPIDFESALQQNKEELWEMLLKPNTHVFVAGLEPILDALDPTLSELAGSEELWKRRKAELKAGQRWVELIY